MVVETMLKTRRSETATTEIVLHLTILADYVITLVIFLGKIPTIRTGSSEV